MKTTLRELIIYIVFLVVLCVSKWQSLIFITCHQGAVGSNLGILVPNIVCYNKQLYVSFINRVFLSQVSKKASSAGGLTRSPLTEVEPLNFIMRHKCSSHLSAQTSVMGMLHLKLPSLVFYSVIGTVLWYEIRLSHNTLRWIFQTRTRSRCWVLILSSVTRSYSSYFNIVFPPLLIRSGPEIWTDKKQSHWTWSYYILKRNSRIRQI